MSSTTSKLNLSRLGPVAILANNAIAARVWFIVSALLAGYLFLQPYLIIQVLKQKEKAVILDGGGTLIYAPILGLEDAPRLNAYHARLACLTLFQRNPKGLDYPDLFDRLFLETARLKAKKFLAVSEVEFRDKQIHQKVELREINILDTRTLDGIDAVIVEAKGQLIKTGQLNHLQFVEPASFSIRFVFVRNPDLLGNQRLPLAVQDFEFKETAL